MKNNKSLGFLIVVILGFFAYMIIKDFPNIIQSLIVMGAGILELNYGLYVLMKILSSLLSILIIVVILYKYISKKISILDSDGKVEFETINTKSILIFGIIAMATRLVSFLINIPENIVSLSYMESLGVKQLVFLRNIDGIISGAMGFAFLLIFVIVLVKLNGKNRKTQNL